MYRREVLERRPLVLPIALLRVQLDKRAGLGERDERDLERRLLGRDEVPGGERALKPSAGMSFRKSWNIRSHSSTRSGDGRGVVNINVAKAQAQAYGQVQTQADPNLKDRQIHTSTLGPKVGPEQRLRMTPKCDLLEC